MIPGTAAAKADRGRRLALALAAGLTVAVAGATAAAQTQAQGSMVVHCHDEARNLVTQTLRDACDGRIVDEAEAEAIRSSRADRLRRVMRQEEREPLFPGRRRHKIGTGFFVARDGTMLTNSHVVDSCAALSVETPAGGDSVGRVLARDPEFDLALVAAEAVPAMVALFAPDDDLRPGLRADLVGYPTQGIAPERPLMSAGKIAQKPPRIRAPQLFLVEADVRSGNSGGPVLDGRGRVIGVVFAQLNTPEILKRTGEVMPDTAVVIDNPTVHAFLRQNGVAFETAVDGAVLDRAAAHEQARGFVARIQCWR